MWYVYYLNGEYGISQDPPKEAEIIFTSDYDSCFDFKFEYERCDRNKSIVRREEK